MIGTAVSIGSLIVAVAVAVTGWVQIRKAAVRQRREDDEREQKKVDDAVNKALAARDREHAAAVTALERSHAVELAGVAHDLNQMTEERSYWRGQHDALRRRLDLVAQKAGLVEPDA